ncbi:MAG: hypothetical protein IJX99_04625 [Clostridia bacterium]|nr:hypothetical protein [Clostridia bacterium]
MDNASKALIMAGAILISLALVGLGVYIFSMAKDLQGNATGKMQSAEISSTNSELESYAGQKVKGSTVISFVERVRVMNSQDIFPLEVQAGTVSDYTFTATGDVTVTDNQVAKSAISANAYYEIALGDNEPDGAEDGYIDTYQIMEYVR